MKCAIVGLPNVGKSTFFNALTGKMQADAKNFPFCTIEPNIARVAVADPRLAQLAKLEKSQKTVPATLQFVDVAGLIAGASKGAGLGNKFLSHISRCDLILHLVRAFADKGVTHVRGEPSPSADITTINTELALADLQTVVKVLETSAKAAKGGDSEAKLTHRVAEKVYQFLDGGKAARLAGPQFDEKETIAFERLRLLTAKPMIYVANVDEASLKDGNSMSREVAELAAAQLVPCFQIAVSLEEELIELGNEGKARLLKEEGIESGLKQVIRGGYGHLGLITFFTAGEKEARAWTIKEQTPAPKAAAAIHGDMERGFISAEVIAYEDYAEVGGATAAKQSGLLRLEGKNYIVKDGDVIHFRFNV